MLKPGIKSSEGLGFIAVMIGAFGAIWFIITKEPPPMFDVETLLGYAKSAENVSEILKLAAAAEQGQVADWSTLGELGGVGGITAYIFQYYTRMRSQLKAKEIGAQTVEKIHVESVSDLEAIKELLRKDADKVQ